MTQDTKLGTGQPGGHAGEPGKSRQADKGLEVEGGVGTARLPGGNAQGKSCSEYRLHPAAAISFDTWLLRGVKAAGGTAGALATTFKAFVRAMGHGLPGANGSCQVREGRAGGGGLAPARAPCPSHATRLFHDR